MNSKVRATATAAACTENNFPPTVRDPGRIHTRTWRNCALVSDSILPVTAQPRTIRGLCTLTATCFPELRPSSRELMWHRSPKEGGPDPQVLPPRACGLAPHLGPTSLQRRLQAVIFPAAQMPPSRGMPGAMVTPAISSSMGNPVSEHQPIQGRAFLPGPLVFLGPPKRGKMPAHWRNTSEGHHPRHRPRKGEDLSQDHSSSLPRMSALWQEVQGVLWPAADGAASCSVSGERPGKVRSQDRRQEQGPQRTRKRQAPAATGSSKHSPTPGQ